MKNSRNLVVRNIQKDDKPAIDILIAASNRVDKLEYSLSDDWFNFVLKEVSQGIFVAYLDNILVGLATCLIDSANHSLADCNLLVHPSYRNQLIGSILYNHLLGYAQAGNIEKINICIKGTITSSLNFAIKRGFKPISYSREMVVKLKEQGDYGQKRTRNLTFKPVNNWQGNIYKGIMFEAFGCIVTEELFQTFFQDTSIEIYFLERNDEIIGIASIQIRENLSLGYIYDIAIIKKYRGQGLGTCLLQFCLGKLKRKNLKEALLTVEESNKKALNFYTRLGFQEKEYYITLEKVLGAKKKKA